MSHFAMLIIGNDIEKQLQPYHEYECTGTKDDYVVWVNETKEKEEEFNTGSRTMLINYDGEIKSPVEDEFYRYPTEEEKKIMGSGPKGHGCGNGLSWSSKDWKNGQGYSTKIKFIPDDYIEKKISFKKIYGTIEKWLKDWEGYDEDNFKDGQIGRWTNPNSKWDWYQIGGRYRGRFIMKPVLALFSDVYKLGFTAPEITNFVYTYDNYPEKFERISGNYGGKTEDLRKFVKDISATMKEPKGNGNGFLSEKGWGSPSAEEGKQSDQAFKKDIDFSKIHQTKEGYDKAIRFWEMKIEGSEPKTGEEKEEMKWDYYKKEYYTKRYKTKETYAKCMSNFTMWGYVKDGKWFEKGDMGWWGCSGESNEDAVKWELEFYDKVIKPLPEDTLLTVVDCHI